MGGDPIDIIMIMIKELGDTSDKIIVCNAAMKVSLKIP